MPRPSVKTERREQILAAYEACVARYGVEGASLEKTAEAAGLARPLIRHNVGNRDDLLDALVERFLTRSTSSMDAMISALPKTGTARTLIDWLFDPKYQDAQFVLVAEALIAVGQSDKSVARKMRGWARGAIAQIRNALHGAYPNADNDALEAVAAGVAGIYFNVDSLSPLGPMTDIRAASKQAALRLVATLQGS